MTEKEAIYILRNAVWLGSDVDRQKVEEAVEVVAKAIEAQNMTLYMNLPEVSVEEAVEILKRNNRIELLTSGKDTNVPSKDTIYRQDAIDAVTSSVMEWDEIYAQDLNVRISEAIQQMPSAQPEREKGKWTKDCACEICGFKPWYERDIHTLSFCPNCGADMR